jgi:hypothetical protein
VGIVCESRKNTLHYPFLGQPLSSKSGGGDSV